MLFLVFFYLFLIGKKSYRKKHTLRFCLSRFDLAKFFAMICMINTAGLGGDFAMFKAVYLSRAIQADNPFRDRFDYSVPKTM